MYAVGGRVTEAEEISILMREARKEQEKSGLTNGIR